MLPVEMIFLLKHSLFLSLWRVKLLEHDSVSHRKDSPFFATYPFLHLVLNPPTPPSPPPLKPRDSSVCVCVCVCRVNGS